MEGTRLRILQLLQKNNHDTVEGLARSIGLAPATIRRHLDILQRDQLVAFEEVRKRTGRPEYSFYLTERGQEALPKGYDQLLGMLVSEMAELTAEDTKNQSGQQLLESVFTRLSDRVTGGFRNDLDGVDIRGRLDVLMHHLGDEDFYPEAAVEDGVLRIELLNCPFRSVALQNKAVCEFDLNLISSMLEVDITRDECIHDGDGSCTYSAAVGAQMERALSQATT